MLLRLGPICALGERLRPQTRTILSMSATNHHTLVHKSWLSSSKSTSEVHEKQTPKNVTHLFQRRSAHSALSAFQVFSDGSNIGRKSIAHNKKEKRFHAALAMVDTSSTRSIQYQYLCRYCLMLRGETSLSKPHRRNYGFVR